MAKELFVFTTACFNKLDAEGHHLTQFTCMQLLGKDSGS